MNEELLAELVGELHNLNLNIMELTQAIKDKDVKHDNIAEQSTGFYNVPVDHFTATGPCPTCLFNRSDGCEHHLPLYGKCSLCSRYVNDCVNRNLLPSGVEQL